jgi:acyl-CoA oxidase
MMDQARKSATFDSKRLSYIIFGRSNPPLNPRELMFLTFPSQEIVQRRNAAFTRVEKILGTDDPGKLPSVYGNINREQAFIEGLKAGRAILEDGIDNNHDFFDFTTERYALSNSSPFGVHTAMFIPTLRLQCTEEQRAYWLPLAESGEIIGAYCQTELGTGTFVRGIQTTATFDEATDEFVIHSPTLSSTKFWPGSIGFSCSHAVVMARLIVKDKDYGIHPFMVQFRSLEDFTPMPGLKLGDIG